MMSDMWSAFRDAERLLIAAEANNPEETQEDDVEASRPVGLLGRLLTKKAA